MKKEKRQVYRDLINMIPAGYGLCNFCKFAEFIGNSCCDGDLECKHPLDCINGEGIGQEPWDVWAGEDCWAFRPNISLQELGEIVSIVFTGNNAHLSKTYGGYIAIIPSEQDKAEDLVGGIV